MATVVPESGWAHGPGDGSPVLEETLDALLEMTGATAGWIGLSSRAAEGSAGLLTFPVRRGSFAEGWLTLQQGQAGVWGLALGPEPAVMNDLPALPELGSPPLGNLLLCVLDADGTPLGHIALANKPAAFTAHDSVAVQTAARLLSKGLAHFRPGRPGHLPPPPWRQALDHVQGGILVFDGAGTLIYANASWEHWTGFRQDELLGKAPPFPFWVNFQEFPALLGQRPRMRSLASPGPEPADGPSPPQVLPFRHRDGEVYWYQVETVRATVGDAPWRVALLRPAAVGPHAASWVTPAPAAAGQAGDTEVPLPVPVAVDWLALLFRSDGTIDFWDERWGKLTGLSHQDLASARGELFLDWLFPRQRDRDFVADLLYHPPSEGPRTGIQAVLEIMSHPAGQAFLCTFLQVGERPANWLMLAGAPRPPEGEAPAAAELLTSLRLDAPTEVPGPHPKQPGTTAHETE
jgi:PAS domain S-box-containing protein